MNRQFRATVLTKQFYLISLAVGSIALFIGMAVAVGSIQDAASMLNILTVCTLGIGLALWLGLAWLIGMVIVGSIWGILWYAGLVTENRGESRPQERLSTEELALVEYTLKAKERGFSDTQIASRLQAQGWSNEEIELAQGLANVNIRRRFGGEEQ